MEKAEARSWEDRVGLPQAARKRKRWASRSGESEFKGKSEETVLTR